MEHSVIQRVKDVIASKELSPRSFAERINYNYSTLNNYLTGRRTNINVDLVKSIVSSYDDINPDWLLTGSGEMYLSDTLSTTENKDARLVPLLPVATQGGTLNDFVVSVKASECEKIISPIRDVDYAMSISGDSMAPEYPSGAHLNQENQRESIHRLGARLCAGHMQRNRHQAALPLRQPRHPPLQVHQPQLPTL